jgi:hypothetical protein
MGCGWKGYVLLLKIHGNNPFFWKKTAKNGEKIDSGMVLMARKSILGPFSIFFENVKIM